MLKIDSFSITAKQQKDNIYKVSWNIKQRGIDLRILVDERQILEVKSDIGSCDLVLPPDGFRTINVLAYSGGSWLKSENSIQVNTYTPCLVDKTTSYFHESTIDGLVESINNIELHLKIGNNIPPNVVGFYYAVRTDFSKTKWPSINDIGADDIHKIGLSAYRKSGEILFTDTARDEGTYYVSLFTIYSIGGKEIISTPKPCRFVRPLSANVFWKVSKSFFSCYKLEIEVVGNRPMVRIPEFTLCVCADNHHLLSASDVEAIKFLDVKSVDLTSLPKKEYKKSYDIKMVSSDKKLKDCKFFFFEVETVPSERFTLRWKKGFKGKV
jgi:hypothetical protein